MTGFEPMLEVLTAPNWRDYELLDSGGGARLERFGPHTFARPDAQALWRRALPPATWEKADAVFQSEVQEGTASSGKWLFRQALPERWPLTYRELRFWVQPTPFRHLGVFPEQAVQWDWIQDRLSAAKRPAKVLNLFGYTGLASLAAASAGATVAHVDASKKAVAWANDNQALSELTDRPIRWLIDDAFKFVQREVRRGSRYEGLILDPPKFGRGPGGEVWKLDDSLPALLELCRQVLSDRPLFVCLTAYAVRLSALSVGALVAEMMGVHPGEITAGEMALVERSAGRRLPTSIFARWSA